MLSRQRPSGLPLPVSMPSSVSWAIPPNGSRPSWSNRPLSFPLQVRGTLGSSGVSSLRTFSSSTPTPLPSQGTPPCLESSDPLQHTAVTIVDVEDEDKQPSPQEEHVMEEVIQKRTRSVGSELFYNVFNNKHPEGTAPLEELHDLLEASGIMASAAQVDAAVSKYCLECKATGCITVSQGQEVFAHLQAEKQQADLRSQELVKAGRFARWMAGLSDWEATNLLLIVVVILCCVSAFLAAGLAILLMIQDAEGNLKRYMQEDLGVVQNSLETFTESNFYSMEVAQGQLFITTLSSIFQATYHHEVEERGTQLLKAVTAISTSMSAWLEFDPKQSFSNAAALLALLTDASLSNFNLSETARILDEINAELPSGYEVTLGRWQGNNTTSAVEFLTALRCVNTTCNVDTAGTEPMQAALAGITSAQRAQDYRNATVYAGYSGHNGTGVEFQEDWGTLEQERIALMKGYVEGRNVAATNSYEFLLAYSPQPDTILLLSSLKDCDTACSRRAVASGSPVSRAIDGESGFVEFTNARGAPAVAAFAPIRSLGMGLVLQMTVAELVATILVDIAAVVDMINRDFPQQSQEFEVATFTVRNGSTSCTHLTAYKFADECPSGRCVPETEYMRQAANNCSAVNVITTTDYRGKEVFATTSCIAALNAILSLKVDTVDQTNEALEVIVQVVNDRIDRDANTSAEFLLAMPKAGLTAADVQGFNDVQVVTKIKYPDACINPNCTWNRTSALLALQGKTEVVDCRDYRNMPIIAAPALSHAIMSGIGIALELDSSEFMQPIIDTAIQVGCFAIGLVVGSTLLLVLVTKLFLRAMIQAKEEGKRAVEKEKDRFSKVVSSMYPAYVLPRLLEGEKQLVCEVPNAAVFFSDIHEFTSASNTMCSKVLLQLLGYVYGVMDEIADRYSVYKVKTVGDAYIVVHGLPGCTSENPSLDLLQFASCVAQVFSTQYVHPSEGDVLSLMNKAMSWNVPRRKTADSFSGQSAISSVRCTQYRGLEDVSTSTPTLPGTVHQRYTRAPSVSTNHSCAADVQCVMSYGLATGPLVAGVLAGRCPMFDIWGGTVNLASRMQSTGEPGCIQVSDQLYKKVIAVSGQPFSFDAPRSVFCKGFGNVNAYMVRTSTQGLPSDLEAHLRLEPRYGTFHFDAVLMPTVQLRSEEERSPPLPKQAVPDQ